MPRRTRRGVALPLVLAALVVAGFLAHAMVTPALALRRASARDAAHRRAESTVERALASVAGGWRTRDFIRLRPGEAWSRSDPAVTIGVVRTSSTTFRIVASSRVARPDAPVEARRVLFAELRGDSAVVDAALTSGGGATVGAGDSIAVDQRCLPGATASIIVAPGARVVWPGADLAAEVEERDGAGAPGTYDRAAGLDIERLAAGADVRLAPGSTVRPLPREEDGVCLVGPEGWGEPLRSDPGGSAACETEFPVVVASGDLHVTGGRSQGILVVRGRLTIAGPFRHAGLIVAAGGIETVGSEVEITGSVYTGPSASARFAASRTRLIASRCVAQAAADANAAIAPLRGWAWAR